MRVEVSEIVPGEYTVVVDGGPDRKVFVPAGVGIAGATDDDLVEALVELLLARGHGLEPVTDVSSLFAHEPGLLGEVEAQLEESGGIDGV